MAPPSESRPKPIASLLGRLRGAAEPMVDRTVNAVVNGLEWWQRDPHEVVDRTPWDPILQRGKLTVRRYRPLEAGDEIELGTETISWRPRRQPVPLLLVPPLMVRPLVFDLSRERSFVRALLAAGFDVYLVDFGVPDEGDAALSLEHYIDEWMRAAVEAVRRSAGGREVGLVGYCMGGLFGLMYAATHPDHGLAALVTIGTPVDSSEMGLFSHLFQVAGSEIEALASQLGNLPGDLSSLGFKLLAPVKSVTRYKDLIRNLWDDAYVDGFDGLTAWTSSFVDYPAAAFQQFLRSFMRHNGLAEGNMRLGGELVDLARVTVPLLAFAGETDRVGPVASVRRVLDLVGSPDRELRVVPGGHMGILGGRHAPAQVWQATVDWLVARFPPEA